MNSAKYFNLLLLGGTAEAYDLADRLCPFDHLNIITSLAGRTKHPKHPSGYIRIGGFGGIAGLERYLNHNKINLVIDATHPFATQIQLHIKIATQNLHIPLIRYQRQAWQASLADQWIIVDDYQAAAQQLILHKFKRVFLTIGSKNLKPFTNLKNVFFLVRVVNMPDNYAEIPTNFHFLCAKGPFQRQQEIDLLQTNKIDVIVSKNSGGIYTFAKIEAARSLNLPVVMVRSPDHDQLHLFQTTTTLDGVLDWVKKQITILIKKSI